MSSFLNLNGLQSATRPAFEVTGHRNDVQNSRMFGTDYGFTMVTRFNQGSHFSTTTGRFTAPATGRYFFAFGIRFDSLPSFTYLHCGLETSNRTRNTVWISQSLNRSYESGSYSTITDMDANDTAEVNSYFSSGGNTTDMSPESTFAGCLMC